MLVTKATGYVVADGRLYRIDDTGHSEDVTEDITGDLAEVLG